MWETENSVFTKQLGLLINRNLQLARLEIFLFFYVKRMTSGRPESTSSGECMNCVHLFTMEHLFCLLFLLLLGPPLKDTWIEKPVVRFMSVIRSKKFIRPWKHSWPTKKEFSCNYCYVTEFFSSSYSYHYVAVNFFYSYTYNYVKDPKIFAVTVTVR